MSLLEGHEGAVALVQGYLVVLEQFVEGLDGEAVPGVGVVLAGLAVAVLAGAVAADELGLPLRRAVLGVLDLAGQLVRHLGLAGLVGVELDGVARGEVVDAGGVLDAAGAVLGGEVDDVGPGVGLLLGDLTGDVPVQLRLVLVVGDVLRDGGHLLLQLLLLGALVLPEHAAVLGLVEGVVVVSEDEAVGVGAEADRGAEVVQLGLLLLAHLRIFPLAPHPLRLDGRVLHVAHVLRLEAHLFLRLPRQQLGSAHLGRLEALAVALVQVLEVGRRELLGVQLQRVVGAAVRLLAVRVVAVAELPLPVVARGLVGVAVLLHKAGASAHHFLLGLGEEALRPEVRALLGRIGRVLAGPRDGLLETAGQVDAVGVGVAVDELPGVGEVPVLQSE